MLTTSEWLAQSQRWLEKANVGLLSPIPTGNDEIQNRKRQDSKISHPQFLSGKWRTLLSNAGGPATVHKGKCVQNNPENGQTEAGM